MKTKDSKAVKGFSAMEMKQELQESFQRKTAGMSFKELRQFLNDSLEPLPQEKYLAESCKRAAERAGEKFRQEQIAAYRAELQKAADKLRIPLNEENLPAIAKEMRAMKTAENEAGKK